MKTVKIKNLIFDLGGVIINLDQELTFQLLRQKSSLSPEKAKEICSTADIFIQYEKGGMDDKTFREELRKTLSCEESLEVDSDWNSMLLDIPLERIALLKSLRKKYNLFLLSNTNSIHMLKVNEILKSATGLEDFTHLFDKIYFSYEMGMRKPDEEIFIKVLEDNNLQAEETLFIDDNIDNINSAEKLNIHTLHVTNKNTLFEYFSNDQ